MDNNPIEAIVYKKLDQSAKKPEWSKPELHILALSDALSGNDCAHDITSGKRTTFGPGCS